MELLYVASSKVVSALSDSGPVFKGASKTYLTWGTSSNQAVAHDV